MLSKEEFNKMWSELWNRTLSKVPGVTKVLSDTSAGIVKKYLYPPKPGKVRINTSSVSVDENVKTVKILIERFESSDGIVSVGFKTNDGTAKAGVDYVVNIGTVGWNNGEMGVKEVTLSIIDDAVFENNEVRSFSFNLFSPTNGLTLDANNSVTISIKDDEVFVPPQTGRQLLGGYRVTGDFARGAIAINWDTRKLYMVGHAQRNEVYEYDLPENYGVGSDINLWPRLNPVVTHPGWWEDGYANGLCMWNGKLWAIVRKFYDTSPPSNLTLFAQDGEKIVINLPRQKFNGFIKGGTQLLIGAGGYESGQGSCSGPTLADLNGNVLINHEWPSSPEGENWNKRAPREPNYYPVNHTDGWVAWEPRVVNGVLEGRWASDRVYGGGLVLPEGICYWCIMGTEDLDYARQSETFGADNKNKVYKYIYDKNTYELLRWEECPDLNGVTGQEIGPDGKIYLCDRNAWRGNSPYQVDPVIKVYG
jgi:hypothetical protein